MYWLPKNTPNVTTIAKTVEDKICIGCGNCTNICKMKCIRMTDNGETYFPIIDQAKCNGCSACIEVCPGYAVDFNGLNLEIFGKSPRNYLAGNYINAYLGYSSDENVRFNASSGGLVTSLLIFAMEEKMIDGALVTSMSSSNPLKPEPFIARSKEEVISAMGSKYCPVPLNTAMKDIIQGNGRFAVVGLPCQIAGIRKLERKMPKLKEKVAYHFGLFCSHTVNFKATLFLLRLFGVDEKGVSKLRYRGWGWPGYITATMTEGTQKFIPFKWYGKYHELFFFTPTRCMLCPDPLSQLADISFGDAWIPEIMEKDTKGTSVCITRTTMGQKLLENAASAGKIILQEMTPNQFREILPSTFRLRRIKALTKILRKKAPLYNINLPSPKILDYVMLLAYFLNNKLSKHEKLWMFIPAVGSIEQHLLHFLNFH